MPLSQFTKVASLEESIHNDYAYVRLNSSSSRSMGTISSFLRMLF